MRMIGIMGWAGAATAAPAHSAVTASSDAGFAIEHRVELAADAAATYAMLVRPDRWWSGDHSYSGDSANLTLDARAGGCFCETIPVKGGDTGSIEHARVIYALPGRQLRLSGALGPLQTEGAVGTLDIAISSKGEGVTVTMTYVVGGYMRTAPEKLAPLVDQVLGEQLGRLKRAVETHPF